MRNSYLSSVVVLAVAVSSACTFYARDPETYKADTRTVVETQNAKIKECYDVALVSNETVTGNAVIKFSVEKKTGKIMNPMVDPSSTAPADLSQCIVNAVDGLVLDPADQREGQATFVWEFKVGAPKGA
jgi:hypothetical protein